MNDSNKSFINKLDTIIKNPRINYKSLGLNKIDYKLLMTNPNITFQWCLCRNGTLNVIKTDPLILKYAELSRKHYFDIDSNIINNSNTKLLTNAKLKQKVMFQKLIVDYKHELSQFGYTDNEIVDILVKYLYHIRNSKHKSLLWLCYGDVIYRNLSSKVKMNLKEIQCIDCGKWINVSIKDNKSCRCAECNKIHTRIVRKEQNKRAYLKKKKLSM